MTLFLPNILCYIRVITSFVALWIQHRQPGLALLIWLLSASLDLFDGILARRLQQTSQLGILMDITADTVWRTTVWMAALLQYPQDPRILCISCLIVLTEWFTFVATQLHTNQQQQQQQQHQQQQHKRHGSDPKSSTTNAHWKIPRKQDPWWVQVVFEKGFRNPFGTWTIYGLFASPLFVWATGGHAAYLSQHIPLLTLWKYLAYSGRLYAFVIEVYFSWSYLSLVVEQDNHLRSQQQKAQASK